MRHSTYTRPKATVAGSLTYGCRLPRIRLQVRVALQALEEQSGTGFVRCLVGHGDISLLPTPTPNPTPNPMLLTLLPALALTLVLTLSLSLASTLTLTLDRTLTLTLTLIYILTLTLTLILTRRGGRP